MTWISTYCCTRIARIYASQQRNLTEIIMDVTQTIALTLGTAWASGINLYAAMLMLGYLGTTGSLDLPPDLQILTNPIVMLSAGIMYCIEFFADKVPGVDTGWDGLSTFIRIPAGAVLAAGAVGDAGTATHVVAALAGGTRGRQPRDQGGNPGPDQHVTRTGQQLVCLPGRGCCSHCRALDSTALPGSVHNPADLVHPADDLAAAETVARYPARPSLYRQIPCFRQNRLHIRRSARGIA